MGCMPAQGEPAFQVKVDKLGGDAVCESKPTLSGMGDDPESPFAMRLIHFPW